MAIVNGYCTLDELDSYIASVNNSDSIGIDGRRGPLEDAITAASRSIDDHCGRVFYRVGTAATARVFPALTPFVVHTDDFYGTATVATDDNCDGTFETAWTAADFITAPVNGVVNGRTGFPATSLKARVSPNGRCFPGDDHGIPYVQVTATWGWDAVPAPVKQACLLQAHRLYSRANSPEGVLGFNEFGTVRVSSLDRDVVGLLETYRRDIAVA